jgi:hypothetical protein
MGKKWSYIAFFQPRQIPLVTSFPVHKIPKAKSITKNAKRRACTTKGGGINCELG